MTRETQDLYFAAFLIAGEGLHLSSIQPGDPYSTFLFAEDITAAARERFFEGAGTVQAFAFAATVRHLKRLTGAWRDLDRAKIPTP